MTPAPNKALADKVRHAVQKLASTGVSMSLSDWCELSAVLLAAADAIATPAPDKALMPEAAILDEIPEGETFTTMLEGFQARGAMVFGFPIMLCYRADKDKDKAVARGEEYPDDAYGP